MTTLRGGYRVRAINQALYDVIADELSGLGWFDANRTHADVKLTMEPQERDEIISPNMVTITPEDTRNVLTGLGEQTVEERMEFYVDVYAESNALGLELTHDIKDILGGLAGNRTHPRVEVFDYRQATPSSVGFVQIERIRVDRPTVYTKPWLKHWFVLWFQVVDVYGPAGQGS